MKRLWLCVVLLCSVAHARGEKKVTPKPAAKAPYAVSAKAWILMDVETGRILEKRNAHTRMFPASTTKTLTALVALRSKRMDAQTVIGPNPPKIGESSIYLQQGERFTVRELVSAAMIKSANDACVAVAEGVSGTVPSFVQQMNAVSKAVGARDSHWMNPHGLHDAGHYTTAYDLALIARAALKDAWFNETVKTHKTTLHGNAKIGATRILYNRNKLLYRWNESDGVKTGYTRQAGRCLIATATRTIQTARGPRRWRLLSVVLHAQDSWKDSRALLEGVGFRRFVPTPVAQAGQEFGVAGVRGGAFDAHAVAAHSIELPLRRSEHATQEPEVRFLSLRAPVTKGQTIGSATYKDGAKTLATIPLVARDTIPVALAARVFPPARAMPSNPPLRWLIWGCTAGSLALALIALKLRARNETHYETTTQRRRTQETYPNESHEEFLERINNRARSRSRRRR
ncbi:MAG TPA: D-alanyl-D-alanine carboxypeptidase family protein [Abditibacteriaceae bacterium]